MLNQEPAERGVQGQIGYNGFSQALNDSCIHRLKGAVEQQAVEVAFMGERLFI